MDGTDDCDGARQTWFGPGRGETPTVAEIEDAASIRREMGDQDMPRGEAVQVAHLIDCYLGWRMIEGVILDDAGDPVCAHAWNVLPDGGIIDATADLHGALSPRVLGREQPEIRHYRREWTATYNPSLHDMFAELRGIRWTGELDALRMEQYAANHSGTMRQP